MIKIYKCLGSVLIQAAMWFVAILWVTGQISFS